MSQPKYSSTSSANVPRILVVDDEVHIRELLEITLIKMGMDVDSAGNLTAARKYFAQNNYSLVLTDMRLPDGLGLELVDDVVKSNKNTPIAVITAFGSTDNAIVALKAGAFDYVSKPVALDQLRKLVHSALQAGHIKSPSNQHVTSTSRLIGQSQAMQDLRTQLNRLARSMAPIAIWGESGSGKELAAREIHAQSARAGKPFVAVNCGAIPEALMEAEFFGYRKGAFTGATEDRDGFFQAANGGTLMLDEVADLPLAMQVKLLRAIQERAVRKIGATVEEVVDVRIISATHQHLEECVANKRFRQDLYYRLNVIELKLPSLRERRADIALLSEAILQRLSGKPVVLSPDALNALLNYDFPGNVRELENILERALAFTNEGVIELMDLALKPAKSVIATVLPVLDVDMAEKTGEVSTRISNNASTNNTMSHVNLDDNLMENLAGKVAEQEPLSAFTTQEIPLHDFIEQEAIAKVEVSSQRIHQRVEQDIDQKSAASSLIDTATDLPKSLPAYLEQVEREMIVRALKKTQFNKTQAAELLGVSFRQLRYQIQKLKIDEAE